MSNKYMAGVSIIMPVYNAEKIIDRTIGSVLNQTYQNFELILIDDGSKDNTSSICKRFAYFDERIKYIYKENGGVSSARNLGIENAGMKYTTFIDSDDYITIDYLETITNAVENFDLIVTNTIHITETEFNKKKTITGTINKSQPEISAVNLFELKTAFPRLDRGGLGTVWNKLFRTQIIIDNDLKFTDIQSEDELFCFQYLLFVNSIKELNYAGYCYIKQNKSISSSHKYMTEINWINKMKQIHQKLNDKFNIIDESYFMHVRARFAERYSGYLLKGYFSDTRVSFKSRIERWKIVNSDAYYIANSSLNLKGNSKYIFLICKYRLFYFIDPFFYVYGNIKK